MSSARPSHDADPRGGQLINDDNGPLFEHLGHEFGGFGLEAVGFLRTALSLREEDDAQRQPRLAEAIAYCIREALKRILDSVERPGAGRWQSGSRSVTAAKRRFDQVRGLPGGDEEGALDELLRRIDELEDLHNEAGIHERRIIAVLVSRTGAVPLEARYDVVIEYQALIEELNTAVHSESDLDAARTRLDRALRVLRQLFLPPDLRFAELDALAMIAEPTPENASTLLGAIYAPTHLRYFFERAVSARWLELLTDSGAVTPPTGQAPWPVYALIERLGTTASDEIQIWLSNAYARWGSDPGKARYLTRAAADIGAAGHDLLARALSDHQEDTTICHTIEWAVRDVPASDPIIDRVADYLLNPGSGLQRIAGVDREAGILAKLVDGVTEQNAQGRLELLSYKLRAVPADDFGKRLAAVERSGSIADAPERHHDQSFTTLLTGLVDAVRAAFEANVDYRTVLSAVARTGDEVASQLRAWTLATGPNVDIDEAVDEIAIAIQQRRPSGDDLLLIDRVVGEAPVEKYSASWRTALGDAPTPDVIAAGLKDHSLDEGWVDKRDWAAILPAECSTGWRTALSLLSAAFGPVTRESFGRRLRTGVRTGQSPMTVKQVAEQEPEDVAATIANWRPDPQEWLVSAHELARTLEEAIKGELQRWLQSPMTIIAALREPIYISHYFRAIAQADVDLADVAGDLVETVAFCRSHPWEPEVLGRDDFDYDPDWLSADAEGIRVLQKLADSDSGFASQAERAWEIVLEAARNRSDASSVSPREDPLQTAINRSCTKALEAVISLMAFEFRASGTIRPAALALLDEVLRLPGWDGAEHRAIVAPRLGFLLHVAPDWVGERAALLIGSAAPGELAQVTVDLIVKWGRPHRWVFERARGSILDAVKRKVENAISVLLIAMLWRVPGYEPETLVSLIAQIDPTLISDAGDSLGRLLRAEDADEEHIRIGVAFWDAVLAQTNLRELAGFGWWSEVLRLDTVEWERLTLATARTTNGRLDWSHAVASRAAKPPISTQGLEILNQLVRGQVDEWDRIQVIEEAVTALRSAGEQLRATEEYSRLRTTLIERGRFDVRDGER